MGLHSAQNIVERPDGGDHLGAFVEHHALGADTHGGVRHFGPSWQTGAESFSRTCVAQITGTWAASHIQRISSWSSAIRS